ncbi:sensor histidine kinase [Streptomyces olivaceus]
MSHLRAPAARADRREGGRHGRPAPRTAPALPDTHIRPQLLRLAVLPPVAVALSACAVVLFTVRSTGAGAGPVLWGVLAGAVSVTAAAVVIAAVAADRAARSVQERVGALRDATTRQEGELRAVVEALRRGETPTRRTPRGGPPADADDFELLAADLSRAHDGAVAAVVRAAQLSSQAGSEQKLEVFLNLARRLQSLVHREISILDELENEIEDPDLLKGLFHVDHLATRIRRHAENLAVLGGAVSRRQWSNPVDMTEVLRSAIAEVEQYSRVRLVPPIDGTLRGHAVADVIHLLAELVENATLFSAPQTQVLMRAGLVTSGLAVEVEDRGLGMPAGEQDRMNALLADPDQVNVARLLADGRIGLFVVSQLAKRHGITVRLQTNIYGGVQAVLVVPQALLGTEPVALPGSAAETVRTTGGGPVGPVQPPRQHSRPVAAVAAPAPPVPSAPPGAAPVPAAHLAPPPAAPAPAAPVPVPPASGPGADSTHGPTPLLNPNQIPDQSQIPSQSQSQSRSQNQIQSQHPSQNPTLNPSQNQNQDANQNQNQNQNPSQNRHRRADGAPVPLPVRGTHRNRPTPAAAVPGVRPEDRGVIAEHAATPPVPRHSAVRGTMGNPQLPRRRAQEHIAPQLRGGPAPRQEPEQYTGHDPALMAAFQRGIGLAEAAQRAEPAPAEPLRPAPPHPPAAPRAPAATPPAPVRRAPGEPAG